ncbi:MAG: hypothetical protein JJ879_00665 [Sneathiella sp.]|nr:hypothetical protein [Sneathiella sp.]
MRKLLKNITFSLIFCLFGTAAAQATSYNAKECRATIQEIYENIDIGKLTLKSDSFLPIYGGFGDSGTITGYETWYSFNECKGNLVIHVDKSCTFAQTYSTTECEIEGIPHY